MSKRSARWIHMDANSMEADGVNVSVKIDGSGALQKSASGLNVKSASITDGMLAGNIAFSKLADSANIARLDQAETITNKWGFPTAGNHPTINSVNIATVDDVALAKNGHSGKEAVVCLAEANITLTGEQTIDGVTTSTSRVLLTGQTDASENGIWVTGAGAWIRPDDFDNGGEAAAAYVFVMEGTTHAEEGWNCTSDTGTVIDTNNNNWAIYTRREAYTAGNGVTLTGSAFSLDAAFVASTGIENDGADKLRLAVQGNGIAGGAGTVLSVNPDNTTGGDTAAVSVSANGVGIDVTTLDGDHLRVDVGSVNYTPSTTPAEATHVDDLAAHLKGIDNALLNAGAGIAPEMHKITSAETTAGFFTLGSTPESNAKVVVTVHQGGEQVNKAIVGATGVTADFEVMNGTELHFNNNGTGTLLSEELTTDDVVTVYYLK